MAIQAKLQFNQGNLHAGSANGISMSNGTMHIFGFNVLNSISFNNVMFPFRAGTSNVSSTFLMGLYSLTGSTLTLVNSGSNSFGFTDGNPRHLIQITSMSTTSNITPGSWYIGIIGLTSGASGGFFVAPNQSYNISNNFPGKLLFGRYSASTTVLPSSINTTDVTQTGNSFYNINIIITA